MNGAGGDGAGGGAAAAADAAAGGPAADAAAPAAAVPAAAASAAGSAARRWSRRRWLGGRGGRGAAARCGTRRPHGSRRRGFRQRDAAIGGCSINGNASFTLDNSAWDAQSYSINGQDTAKPAYAKARAQHDVGRSAQDPQTARRAEGHLQSDLLAGPLRNGTTSHADHADVARALGRFLAIHRRAGSGHDFRPAHRQSLPREHDSRRTASTRPRSGLLKYYPTPNAPGYKQNYQAPITTIRTATT